MFKRRIGWRAASKLKEKFQRTRKWAESDPLWIVMFVGFIMILGMAAVVGPEDAMKPLNASNPYQDIEIPQEWRQTRQEGSQEEKKGVVGVASWYDYSLDGIEWSKTHDTCAVRDWPRYSKVRATNLANGKSVDCYINDDGPRDCEYRYKYKLDKPGECIERIIDLSSHAFAQIADLKSGLADVRVEEIE